MEVLARLLQHLDCVVCNAGTILLDALVNDRPAVCVVYDEGAPEGERHAELAEERRRVALEVVDEVDGKAADRVVDAILGVARGLT